MKNYIVVDLETTGLDCLTDRIHGVGVVWPDGRAEYHPQLPSPELRMWLRNPEVNVVGHNLRFDIKFLEAAGVEIRAKLWDTKLLAQLLNENQELGLKPLSEKYFGVGSLENKRRVDRAVSHIGGKSVADLCKADLEAPGRGIFDIIADYCIEDCHNTAKLWDQLTAEAKAMHVKAKAAGLTLTPLDYYMTEAMPLESVLRAMELKGIRIDTQALVRYRGQLQAQNDKIMLRITDIAKEHIDEIEEELYQKALATKKSEQGRKNVERSSDKYNTAFNWQSADHLSTLIFNKFGAGVTGVEKTASGKLSTSETSLSQISQRYDLIHPLRILLEEFATWKKNLKLLSTYTGEDKGLLAQVINGRIHADYLQAGHGKESSQGGTVTGRLSSRNPNMQNLPRGSEIKRFFVPDPGKAFIYFDYSQLELRLAAHLSQDPLLIKAYQEGLDLHQLTADAIGVDRQMGKTINFAMIYDASPWRLSDILQRPTDECKEIIKHFYGLYKGYASYLRNEKKQMLERGWVCSLEGRVRRLPVLKQKDVEWKEINHAIKQGYNFPIQSLGASITKLGMIELHKQGYELLTTVHDSVVVQVPIEDCKAQLPLIVKIAESIYPCSVPIKVDAKILTSLHEADVLKEQNDEQHSNDRKDSSGNASTSQHG